VTHLRQLTTEQRIAGRVLDRQARHRHGAGRTAQAAPITIPTGLNPGDTYRLAFVTSTTRDATSTDINDYNAFVTAAANTQATLAALATTWTAITSTAAVEARANTNTFQASAGGSNGVPIFLMNGTQLVSGYDSLWDGDINVPLYVTEAGTAPQHLSFVWTRTEVTGFNALPLGAGALFVAIGASFDAGSN
jgi:hypothetical protein